MVNNKKEKEGKEEKNLNMLFCRYNQNSFAGRVLSYISNQILFKKKKFRYRQKYQYDPPLAKRFPRTVSFQENLKCL